MTISTASEENLWSILYSVRLPDRSTTGGFAGNARRTDGALTIPNADSRADLSSLRCMKWFDDSARKESNRVFHAVWMGYRDMTKK